MSPFSQFIFSLFVIVVSFLFFMVVSVVIAIPLFDLDLNKIATITDISNPDNIDFLKYFQVVQSIGLFIVPPIILAWLFMGNVIKYLQLHKSPGLASILLVVLLTVSISPAINLLGEINSKMAFPEWMSGIEDWMRNSEENAAQLTEAFLDVTTIKGLFFNLFMIAFLPAIGEEFLFRGVIQKIFIKWTKNSHLGIWIAAILFSALHLQFYGFLPRMILGVLFGYMLVWSGSMWLPIIAHFINNGVAVAAMWMVKQGRIDPSVEELGATPDSLYTAIISAVLTIFLMWYLMRLHQLKKNNVKY